MVNRCLLLTLMIEFAAGFAGAAPQGGIVYVGTYADGGSRGIYRFRFDDATGRLYSDGLAAETGSPSFLASDAGGRFVFAVNENDSLALNSGGVTAFEAEPKSGGLRFINQQPSGGSSPCHLTLDRTGRFLLVANYGGSVSVLPVAKDGRLSPPVVHTGPKGRGPHPRQDRSHPHGVYLDRTNTRLLVPDLGLDRILAYSFDPARGSLKLADSLSAALAPQAGPRHLAWSSDGRHVYSVNELDSTVTTFAWDPKNGRLSRRGSVSTLPDDSQGENYTAEIALHPSGRFLYASNRGDDSIVVLAVDPSTGALTRTAVVPVGGRKPRHFVIAPSGRWMLVAHQTSGTIAVLSLNPETGRPQPAGDLVNIASPVSLLFLPAPASGR